MARENLDDRSKFWEILLSALAIVISIVALITSVFSSIKSNSTATEALNVAKQANDIASGKLQTFPKLSIIEFPTDIQNFDSDNGIRDSEISVTLINDGDVIIDQVAIQILVSDLFSYEKPDMNYEGVHEKLQTVTLSEQLAPHGLLRVDLKIPIFRYLSSLSLENPSATYRGIFNVVFLSRKTGEQLPIQYPGTHYDRQTITVIFSPQILNRNISIYSDDKLIDYQVFNYSK